MSTLRSHELPEALKNLHTRPLFVLREQVPPLLVVGQTPDAFRRIGVIQGGSFEGEQLSGEVVSGNDWQAVRTDSCYQTGRPACAQDDGRRTNPNDLPVLARRSSKSHREAGQGRGC